MRLIVFYVYICDLAIPKMSKWTVCFWSLIHESVVHKKV